MGEPQRLEALLCGAAPGSRVVAYDDQAAWRFDQLLGRVWGWAARLREREGRAWALYHDDGFEFLCALLGAWAAGKTAWLPADTLPTTVARLGAHVDGWIGEFAGDGVLTPVTENGPVGTVRLDPSTRALVVYTSGSTGEPTAIAKTFGQLENEICALHVLWGDRVRDHDVLATVPHRHLYGLLFKLLWPLARGAAFCSGSLSYPEQVVAWAARKSCVWIASPALLKRLPDTLDWSGFRERGRVVFSSGSALDETAAVHCARVLGRAVVEVYGSSETGGVAWRAQSEHGGSWQPLPGVDVTVDDATGRLCIDSPWLEGDTPWLGNDAIELGSDGGFKLLGRIDRIVKVEDKRISLELIEQSLLRSELVQEVRVVQLHDGRLGAVVVPSAKGAGADRRAVSETLRASLRNCVDPLGVPRRWRLVGQLPFDSLGKVTHAALQRLFDKPELPPEFPKIISESVEANTLRIRLLVSPDLVWFDGHFPRAAILPGVVQLHWAVQIGRKYFPLRGDFHRLERIKFQQVIRPPLEVDLRLEYRTEREALDFEFSSAMGTHSSGRVQFDG